MTLVGHLSFPRQALLYGLAYSDYTSDAVSASTDYERQEPSFALAKQSDVYVEVGGPDAQPDRIDARAMLELSAAYFDLLVRVARSRGADLKFRGLDVEDKCIALRSTPSSVEAAREAANDADGYILGREEPPHGILGAVQRVQRAVRALPPGHNARVIIGPWKRAIATSDEAPKWPPYASVSVRATLIGVGGKRPRARFSSESESDEFSLDITQEMARDLGPYMYREIDIVGTVYRDETDAIRGGELEEFFPLEEGSVRDAWRSWVKENAPRWFELEDVDAELHADSEGGG